MKKFFIILVILILLAGAGFGVGYVPLRLQAGTTAIMFSKTSGWDRTPIIPGEFAWRWELLIPTNATLHRFSTESRTVRVRATRSLPSAELYRQYLEGEPALEQEIAALVRYRVAATAVAELAPMGLTPAGFPDWYEQADDEIRSLVVRITERALLATASRSGAGAALSDEVAQAIADQLQRRMAEYEIQAVVIEELIVPDLELYRLGRETYLEVQAARDEALLQAVAELAVQRAGTDQMMEDLQRYGRILTEYPILLDYLEIAARNGRDVLALDALGLSQTEPEDAAP